MADSLSAANNLVNSIIHEQIKVLHPDLAVHIVMAGTSGNSEKIRKAASLIAHLHLHIKQSTQIWDPPLTEHEIAKMKEREMILVNSYLDGTELN